MLNPTTIQTAPVGKVTSYLETNLAGGTTYFFSVTAYDSAGMKAPTPPRAAIADVQARGMGREVWG